MTLAKALSLSFLMLVLGPIAMATAQPPSPQDLARDAVVWSRLHVDLAGETPPSYAILSIPEGSEENPVLGAYVMFDSRTPLASAARIVIERYDGYVIDAVESLHALVIAARFGDVRALAGELSVRFVHPALPLFDSNNDQTRISTQVDAVQAPPYGLDGSGVRVFVYDVGTISEEHPDFAGRLKLGEPSSMSDHSTHVAGTIGGNGTASPDGIMRGMAPCVTFRSAYIDFELGDDCPPGWCPPGSEPWRFITNPGDIEENYEKAIGDGADIASNSIGLGIAGQGGDINLYGDYTFTSALLDAIVVGKLGRPLPVIWAAGNEGGLASIPPPGAAKNMILVGALNNPDDSVASFSSGGPTDDGRLKPDLVAPGCAIVPDGAVPVEDPGITSCWGSELPERPYRNACGTSMATPVVAGVSSLVIQEYRRLFLSSDQHESPRNATLRAVLCHTAEDLGTPGPDYHTGYGAVRARDAIDLLRTRSVRERSCGAEQAIGFRLRVPADSDEVKITIAWDDPPNLPYADPALVNDLDLVVYDPNGVRHYPYTLDPSDPQAAATRDREDHLNIIEQVHVENPTPGNWRIAVVGSWVDEGQQDFSIVTSPPLNSFTGW